MNLFTYYNNSNSFSNASILILLISIINLSVALPNNIRARSNTPQAAPAPQQPTQQQVPSAATAMNNLAPLLPPTVRQLINSFVSNPSGFLSKANNVVEHTKIQEVPGDYVGTLMNAFPKLSSEFKKEFNIKSEPAPATLQPGAAEPSTAFGKWSKSFSQKIGKFMADTGGKFLGIPQGTLADKLMRNMIEASIEYNFVKKPDTAVPPVNSNPQTPQPQTQPSAPVPVIQATQPTAQQPQVVSNTKK